jgi:hypothetical protein
MALGGRLARLGAVAIVLSGRSAAGQPAIRGTVIAKEGRTPIAGATVTLRRGGAAATDLLGRFRLELLGLPDTLTVSAIGWRPDTIALDERPLAPITIGLARAPVVVSDLIATAARSVDRPAPAQWAMPIAAARTVPPAIETDVYRSLALVPAVSFTSPLSSRPLVRGYDASEVTTRVDGFEVMNLYHLGRVFSSFPADGAEQVVVSAPPAAATIGQSVAGLIDVIGRTGPSDGTRGNLGISFGSLSGSVGGAIPGLRLFAAGRFFHAKLLELVPGVHLPYQFEDLYLSAALGGADRPRGRITVFATRDRIGQSADRRLDWDNVLVGAGGPVLDRGGVTLDVGTSVARFRETGVDVPSPSRGPADFANRFGRWSSTVDLVVSGRRTRVEAGAEIGIRTVTNRIGPSRPGALESLDFPSAATRHQGGFVAGWAAIARRMESMTLEGSLRMDGFGAEISVSPRLLASWTAGRASIRAGLGRTTRLYQLVGDAQSEPELDFLDLWLPPGDTVPAARVDHATIDFVVDWRPVIARISWFGSRGEGQGELRPESDQRAAPRSFVRFGRARTRGLEAQVAVRDIRSAGRSISVSYTYARSERDWGAGWVRWSQDRRHQLRVFGQTHRRRFAFFTAFDLASGMPLTPIAYRVTRDPPDLPGAAEAGRALPVPVYGPENSYGTSGTVRVDGGASYEFKGRGRARYTAGLSIINLFGGPVAPIGTLGSGPAAFDRQGRPTAYRRRFALPGIPTLTLRVEF